MRTLIIFILVLHLFPSLSLAQTKPEPGSYDLELTYWHATRKNEMENRLLRGGQFAGWSYSYYDKHILNGIRVGLGHYILDDLRIGLEITNNKPSNTTHKARVRISASASGTLEHKYQFSSTTLSVRKIFNHWYLQAGLMQRDWKAEVFSDSEKAHQLSWPKTAIQLGIGYMYLGEKFTFRAGLEYLTSDKPQVEFNDAAIQEYKDDIHSSLESDPNLMLVLGFGMLLN